MFYLRFDEIKSEFCGKFIVLIHSQDYLKINDKNLTV